MRHHNKNKKFGRKRNQRKALLRSLALSLIKEGKIETTVTRAKAVRPFVEKLVTRGKEGGLPARRLIRARLGVLGEKKLTQKIMPLQKARPGGYTRIVKSERRASDGSQMAIIEFVEKQKAK